MFRSRVALRHDLTVDPSESPDVTWRALEREAFRSAERSVDATTVVAGAIATTAPLVVGAIIGNHALGLFCALGGLNTALVMGPFGRPRRFAWGLFTALSGTGAVGLATLTHHPAWVAVVITVVWSISWALLRAIGPEGALVGFTTTAVFIIVNGIPGGSAQTFARVVEYAVGSGLALGLMLLPRPAIRDTKPRPIPWSLFTRSLRRDGIVRRHAIRVGVVAGIATVLYRILNLTFGYWIPLTAVAVLQPDAQASRVRALQRTAGTLIGTAIVAVVALLTRNEGVLVLLVLLASAGLFALKERGYFWFTMLLTPTALLMLSTVQFHGWSLGVTRVVNTGLGLLIALVVIEIAHRGRDSLQET